MDALRLNCWRRQVRRVGHKERARPRGDKTRGDEARGEEARRDERQGETRDEKRDVRAEEH